MKDFSTIVLVFVSIQTFMVTGSNVPNIKLAELANPIITTPLGSIEGTVLTSRLGKRIFSFRGIRYAKAPVDDLRFQPPQPVEKWEGTYNATADGPACPQPERKPNVTSEDCLVLNIYSTKLPSVGDNPRRPIIVFFHPGGFYGASGSSDWLGPQYFMDKDIVLVVANYRLGSLGFISTGDKHAPGNNGFKDQVEVLRWIKQNIVSFGGDPELVTISGLSAGAISVGLHMVSPMSRGLFHRAIAMSGAPTSNFKLEKDQLNLAKKQAELLGCPTETSGEIVACLKTKTHQELGSSLPGFAEYGGDPILIWGPVIESDFGQERFLTDDPTRLVKSGKYTKVPLMTGISEFEFAGAAYYVIGNETLLNTMDQNFSTVAPIAFIYERDTERSKEISATFRDFYFGNSRIDKSQVTKLGQLYSDGLIGFGVHRLAQLVAASNDNPVFYYRFSYRGMYSYFYLPGSNNSTPLGPVHHDELIYLFYNSLDFPLFDLQDPATKTVERLTTMWANFAKTGNPTPDKNTLTDNAIWEPLTPSNHKYMDIQCHLQMKEDLYADRYSVWDSLFPLPR